PAACAVTPDARLALIASVLLKSLLAIMLVSSAAILSTCVRQSYRGGSNAIYPWRSGRINSSRIAPTGRRFIECRKLACQKPHASSIFIRVNVYDRAGTRTCIRRCLRHVVSALIDSHYNRRNLRTPDAEPDPFKQPPTT